MVRIMSSFGNTHTHVIKTGFCLQWNHIETTERASMRQHKIKCVFVPSEKEEDEDNVITEEEKVCV